MKNIDEWFDLILKDSSLTLEEKDNAEKLARFWKEELGIFQTPKATQPICMRLFELAYLEHEGRFSEENGGIWEYRPTYWTGTRQLKLEVPPRYGKTHEREEALRKYHEALAHVPLPDEKFESHPWLDFPDGELPNCRCVAPDLVHPVVFIETPLRSSEPGLDKRLEFAQAAMFDSIQRGEAPILTHLLWPAVMNDHDPEEREQALRMCRDVRKRCHKVVFYVGMGVSPGMARGMLEALEDGIKVEVRMIEHVAKPVELPF